MDRSGRPTEQGARQLNLPFWIALLVVVALYAAAFFVLRLLIPEQEIAGTLAAMVLGGGAYVQRAIERRIPHRRGRVVPLAGYERPWWILLAVCVIAIWLALSLGPYIQLRGGPVTAVSSTIDTLLRLVPPGVALLVGLFVGQRSDRYAFPVVAAAVLIGYALSLWSADFVASLATGGGIVPPSGPPGAPPDPRGQYLGDGIVRFLLDNPLTLLAAAGMIGFWRGTRTRLAAYLGSLLGELSDEDRAAFVELAFESAEARSGAAATDDGEPPVSAG